MTSCLLYSIVFLVFMTAVVNAQDIHPINIKGCDRPLDIIFVLDASGNISEQNWENQLDFVMNITDVFSLNQTSGAQVGIVSFGGFMVLVVPLGTSDSPQDLSTVLNTLSQKLGGKQRTDKAIQEAVLALDKAGRAMVNKVIVLVSNGPFSRPGVTIQTALEARARGIEILIINVGPDSDSNAESAASRLEFVYRVDSYSDLGSLANEIATTICQNVSNTTSGHGQVCAEPMDTFFVIDGSDSMSRTEFLLELNFAKRVVGRFILDEVHGVRTGALVFSSQVGGIVGLEPFNDHTMFDEKLYKLPHDQEGTNTFHGIRAMRDGFENQGRPDVKYVGIVITDGRSKNRTRTIMEAELAKEQNITMLAVGIGLKIDKDELYGMASDPHYVYIVKDFESLDELGQNISLLICPSILTVTTTEAPDSTTVELTTEDPTTEEPTTEEATTEEPTTADPTTEEPTTPDPTTEEPTTPDPTTEEPTTPDPTTEEPITPEPTTEEVTTPDPTTEEPTTPDPTTEEPTTPEPTMEEVTTPDPTTEKSTTAAPTRPEEIRDPCSGCRVVNGVGYNTHPSDCTMYTQCYPGLHGYEFVYRQCGDGLFWDQKNLICNWPSAVTCTYDPCRGQAFSRVDMPAYCGTYWKCSGGRVVSHGCCPAGYAFEGGEECVLDSVCLKGCMYNIGLIPTHPCPLKEHAEHKMYYAFSAGGTPIEMPCPPGTGFNPNTCVCSDKIKIGTDNSCKPALYLPFDDFIDHAGWSWVNNQGSWINNVPNAVGGKAAYFNGRTRVLVPRFSNHDFRGTVLLTFRYLADYHQMNNITEALVTNGDCHETPSIATALNKKTNMLEAALRTDAAKGDYHMSIAPDVDSWVNVTYRYHNGRFISQAGKGGENLYANGNINLVQSALHIGDGTGYKAFRGHIDELKLYLCIP